jgi:phosphotransferase system  glucose/maltose/N-acetylglucosamine-specific IIC component
MDDDEGRDEEVRDAIVRLEDSIEQHAQAIESCRKFMLASRIAIVAGAILLAALVLGVTAFSPMAMVAAFAAVIGGVVLLGSNRSTLQEATAALQAAEAQRAALIGEIDLRVVSSRGSVWPMSDPARPPTLH